MYNNIAKYFGGAPDSIAGERKNKHTADGVAAIKHSIKFKCRQKCIRSCSVTSFFNETSRLIYPSVRTVASTRRKTLFKIGRCFVESIQPSAFFKACLSALQN